MNNEMPASPQGEVNGEPEKTTLQNTNGEELQSPEQNSGNNVNPEVEAEGDNHAEAENPTEVSETVQAQEEPSPEAENENATEGETISDTLAKAVEKPAPQNEVSTAEENTHNPLSDLSIGELLDRMEEFLNADDAGAQHKKFLALKDETLARIHERTAAHKQEHLNAGKPEEDFREDSADLTRFNELNHLYRDKHDTYIKNLEAEHRENLDKRLNIIERLKNLYTNTEPGTNLFRAIREIKEEWAAAGQVAKAEFKNLNNNYFHHLNGFYQMLDLNKEYREQEYAHNLEKRQHIIQRARELQEEPVVQKALNELQYLHKLWKEEAEPVAEEHRESTWEEFKEISNKIHERKTELLAEIEKEQEQNLVRKNEIIANISKLSSTEKGANHNHWQNAIKKIEELRSEFLKLGSVPKKLSNQNWNEFKAALKNFNTAKNDFYKNLKGSQVQNLERKLNLISTARDNMNSEDWETSVPLFKKLQEEWKTIGHVPRSQTNKVWDEFREACNTFFNNFREKNNAKNDDWKENYRQKRALLDELKTITDEEGSIGKIEQIKNSWNAIGKVPREKISINTEFNKALREKLRLNKIHEYDLREEGLSETQLTDKARKIKNQVADLEAEISQLENNLSFFSNPSRENPLLSDTYNRLDDKKAQLESMKQSLHNIISGGE